MTQICFTGRRTLVVVGVSMTGLAAGHASTAAARAGPVKDTKVIVATIHRSHGQPAAGSAVRRACRQATERRVGDAHDGVALVSVHDELLPARTTDGGRIWRIDGPGLFTEQAADAAAVVNNLDAENASTFYAYGGGQVVDITSDGGRVWRPTFQGLEAGVSPIDHGLAAYVDQSNSTGTQGVTIQFYTTNGGRSWRAVKGYDF